MLEAIPQKTRVDSIESLELLKQLCLENQQTNLALARHQEILLEMKECLQNIETSLRNPLYRKVINLVRSPFTPQIGILNQYRPKPFSAEPKAYAKHLTLDHTPTFSIVTPSFNQGKFLERTICSVLMQKYPALEYILQDGHSNDNTPEILDTYKHAFKHCESVRDGGQSQALNMGFRHATGEIMAYLNSDDLLMSGALNYVANYFTQHPDIDVVYGHRIIIDEQDREIGRWILPPHSNTMLEWADFIPQETLFWRRRIWEKTGGKIEESFRFAMDWDLLLRFKEAGAKFARLPRFLGAFRVHRLQKTSAEMDKNGELEMSRLRSRCHGRPITFSEVKKKIHSYELKHVLYNNLYKMGILRY